MTDPLAEVVTLLQPTARYSKLVSCSGQWHVRRSEQGQSFYMAILEGSCCLHVDGHEPLVLQADDFVLVPAAYDFAMTSLEMPPPEAADAQPQLQLDGTFRIGPPDAPLAVRALVGHGVSASPDAELLVSLLPKLVLVRNEKRLATLVHLIRDECREQRPARDLILSRLLEIVFIEALRSTDMSTSPGLLRGLGDARLVLALRCMHEHPEEPWSVSQLAKAAALSRSAFFDRFSREVGIPPMEYLLSWRMALAKSFLRTEQANIATIAQRVGYASSSAFSVAFTRHVGMPPSHYLREVCAVVS